MEKTIFTVDCPRTKKYTRRIKTHNGGVPILSFYQETLTWEENHILAAQHFVNTHGLHGSWISGKINQGFSWTQAQFNTFFYSEQCIVNNFDIQEGDKMYPYTEILKLFEEIDQIDNDDLKELQDAIQNEFERRADAIMDAKFGFEVTADNH